MKLLLIGGLVGLTFGVGLTILYFSLATFFTLNARALKRNQKAAEKMATRTQKTHPSETRERLDELEALQKVRSKTAAKAGN